MFHFYSHKMVLVKIKQFVPIVSVYLDYISTTLCSWGQINFSNKSISINTNVDTAEWWLGSTESMFNKCGEFCLFLFFPILSPLAGPRGNDWWDNSKHKFWVEGVWSFLWWRTTESTDWSFHLFTELSPRFTKEIWTLHPHILYGAG